ncbi:MAG: hypothetical protein IMHGJWDQ_002082 [Candidatus Fervidibacter sp.]
MHKWRILWWLLVAVFLTMGGLWLWQEGKRWWTGQRVRELMTRLTARVTTVTPSPAVILMRVQALNRLETARLVTQHIVEAKSAPSWLPEFLAGERVLLIAQAETRVGVNLQQLSQRDVQVDGDAVTLFLPPPQILSVRLDEFQTRVFTRERGWLVFNPDPQLERTARLQALQEARRAAMQSELLSFARQQAEANLTAFLHALGFRRVEIRWRTLKITPSSEAAR